ncbi:MAG: class B sortase [Coriobacteriales bacterium]|jgi:sortase B|nr:class B sortase [Coriobacteriales bacterium]
MLSRVLLVSGCVLIVGALAITAYVIWGYLDAQNRYAQIESVAGLQPNVTNAIDPEMTAESLDFNWESLLALNPDLIGWIIVPGTHINYPVVQGTDNTYYLYHLFDEESSGTGAIFADYRGSRSLDAQNNMIYGHNMWDGSMFSDLVMYTSQDYFDEHRTVYLFTPARTFELQALATLRVEGNAPIRVFDFAQSSDFSAYLDLLLTDPVSAASDLESLKPSIQSIYSLVTCNTYDNSYRIILSCMLVSDTYA